MKQPYITFAFVLLFAISVGMMLTDGTSPWWFLGVAIGFYGSVLCLMHYYRKNEDQ